MNHWLCDVSTYHPYKKDFHYRIPASTIHTAGRRALMAFRKEDGIRRKRLDSVTLQIKRYSSGHIIAELNKIAEQEL